MVQDNALYAALAQDVQLFYEDHPEQYHPFLSAEHDQLINDGIDLEQIDQVTLALFSEINSCRFGFHKNEDSTRKYYDYVCEQIYFFFTQKGYGEEFYTAAALKEMLITTSAVTVVQRTGWNAAFVTAAVTLVVSTVIKVGVRSWCRFYEDRHPNAASNKS